MVSGLSNVTVLPSSAITLPPNDQITLRIWPSASLVLLTVMPKPAICGCFGLDQLRVLAQLVPGSRHRLADLVQQVGAREHRIDIDLERQRLDVAAGRPAASWFSLMPPSTLRISASTSSSGTTRLLPI